MGKRKPRGRNFTPDERQIMLKVVMTGGSVLDVNQLLASHQQAEGLTSREMPAASFDMMKNTYLRYLQNDDAVKEHIFHPSPMGKLKSRHTS